ncbi:MAG: hypothetical protein KDB68_10915 [Planctomycetes bacterium]|nr:hypothetical protein [Planctomycetota bacterium]
MDRIVCGYCNSGITEVVHQFIPSKSGMYERPNSEALVLSCPKCNKILGAEVSPAQVRSEIVAEVVRALKNS